MGRRQTQDQVDEALELLREIADNTKSTADSTADLVTLTEQAQVDAIRGDR